MNLLYNPLTQALSTASRYLLWPIHMTLGRLSRMLICQYLFLGNIDAIERIVMDQELTTLQKINQVFSCLLFSNIASNNDIYNACQAQQCITDEQGGCTITSRLEGYSGVSYTISPNTVNIDKESKKQKHIIIFLGNAQIVQRGLFAKWIQLAEDNQVRVTIVEHPGAIERDSKRKPVVFNDLINNGAEVFAAIQKQYKLEAADIGLYGQSLGGAIATQVATRFYKTKEDCPHLLVDRSFSSIASVIVGWILRNKPRSFLDGVLFTLVQIPLAIIAYAIVKPLLLLSGWEAHTGVYYANLPKARKHYLFIRTNKADRKDGDVRGDDIITRLASLDSSVFQVVPRLIQKYWTKWFKKEEDAARKNERASHKIMSNGDDLHNELLNQFHDHIKPQGRSGNQIIKDWVEHKTPRPSI